MGSRAWLGLCVAEAVVVAALSAACSPNSACGKDADCKGNQICVSGTCQFPVPLDAGNPSTDGGSPDAGPVDAGTGDAGAPDGGPGDGGVVCGSGGGISYSVQIQPIFDSNCIACHAGATPAGGLALTVGSYGNLVNVPCQCDAGVLRVKPCDTAGSMLWLKTANDPRKCGASEPKGQPPLSVQSPAEFQQLTQWIEGGALNN
jgi:hypothetical protein